MKSSLSQIFLLLLAALCLFSCGRYGKPDIHGIAFKSPGNEQLITFSLEDSTIKVFMFMSPECPLCINYTQPYTNLVQNTTDDMVRFFIVYPGKDYPEDEILSFQSEYQLEGTAIMDLEYNLTNLLKATVTPQVIILNGAGEKVYTGAFDNWAYEPGRKRQVITEHYVADALNNLSLHKYPNPKKTEPIGCFIEL